MNLPELPEGYFWRVTENPLIGNKPFVELRKKVWFFSVRIAARWTHDVFGTIQEEVEYLAQSIYNSQIDGKLSRARLLSILGDYHS